MNLIKDIRLDAYQGLEKPEALNYELHGYWLRRIDDKHRLAYKVKNNILIVISCKFYYKKNYIDKIHYNSH